MATKRRRGAAWHYVIKRTGLLPRPLYLSFDSEREGDEYVKRTEALLDRGIVPAELQDVAQDKRLLRTWIRDYLAKQPISKADRIYLVHAQHKLPVDLELRQLTFAWATEWVAALKREHNLAPSTLRHHVGAVARCLDWVCALGDIPMNPLRLLRRGYAAYTAQDAEAAEVRGGRLKLSSDRDRRLQPGEEEAIRAVLAGAKPAGRERAFTLNHQAALVLLFDLALETAMRMAEMYTLAIDQVDLPRRTIFLDRTKNGSKRQVPLSSVALQLLQAYIGERRSGLLFPWWNGDRAAAELKRTTSLLSRQFARIFDAAGAAGLHFHDLRHEATSRLYERTQLSDGEIAKITGHLTIRQLLKYANLRGSTLASKLW